MRRIMTLLAGGVCVGILCVMIFFHVQGSQALAMTQNLEKEKGQGTGTVILEYGREKPIQQAIFCIFQVAEKTESGSYVRRKEFQSCPVQIDFEESSWWRETAETLEIYVTRDRITPALRGVTDLNGRLKFENLGEGIYLIVGEKRTEGLKTYIPEPILTRISLESGDETHLPGRVVVHPKYREEENAPSKQRDRDDSPEKVRLRAVKIWDGQTKNGSRENEKEDHGNQDHPEEVVIELLRDGVITERTVLSEKNQWSCVWENLDAESSWKVAEEVPEGYVVSIRQEGETFLLTNRRENRELEETETNPVEEPEQPKSERLPQTGNSWYLAGIFGLAGIFFWAVAGCLKKAETGGKRWWRVRWILRFFGACGVIVSGVFAGKNAYEEIRAWNHVRESQNEMGFAEKTNSAGEHRNVEMADGDSAALPLYLLDLERKMPEKVIDGAGYIGMLELPTLQRELPVMSVWTEKNLQKAPCRYSGSAYMQNLVIAGHNYRAHFSGIGNLKKGDSVIFTDMDGNRFFYEVSEIEILDAQETERMTESWWALTLFTCTAGGKQRIAVRCDASVVQGE
ncbi:sortase [Brotaphodocola sp.]|uniref:sortase n=1 Tax=Brotaphodocola sp. TaxID=3073577 RepID=UPI003D7E8DFD